MESLEGKKFVITGNVHIFSNRDEFKQYVTKHGGKVIGRISKNADYLVANDRESGTIKISEAEEAGVPIISERKFIKMFGDEGLLAKLGDEGEKD